MRRTAALQTARSFFGQKKREKNNEKETVDCIRLLYTWQIAQAPFSHLVKLNMARRQALNSPCCTSRAVSTEGQRRFNWFFLYLRALLDLPCLQWECVIAPPWWLLVKKERMNNWSLSLSWGMEASKKKKKGKKLIPKKKKEKRFDFFKDPLEEENIWDVVVNTLK